jgi:peptidoglycan/LPS O-acetylase OafA/YrhL
LLRTVAVLAVFLNHLANSFGLHSFRRLDFADLGRLGVLFFFVHTALVLMQSMERKPATAASFYLRRAFRIYPLSLVCVSAFALLRIPPPSVLFPLPDFSAGAVAANLALIQNATGNLSITAVLWSLPYEVQMYLLLPAAYLLARRCGSRGVALATMGAALLYVALHAAGCALAAKLIVFLPCFLSGVLAFALLRKGRAPRFPSWLFPVCLALFCLLACAGLDLSARVAAAWPVCYALGLLLPAFAEIRNRCARMISQQIARYSYGIYLFHLVAMWAGLRVSRYPLMQLAAILALTAALSFCGYHLIEAPMIRLGKRIAEGIRRPVVPTDPRLVVET